jgi:RNA polymerase sigma-70 factor (ECF subfamily)
MYRQPRTGLSPGKIVLLIGAVLVALVGDRMPGVVAALQLSHAFKTRMDANLRAARVGPPEEVDVYLESAPSFEEFYRAKYRRLFTALCLVTGDRHEAEEVAQEAFVRVFERWDHVGLLDDPTGYVFRVSMNVFRGRYRRASLGLRRALSLAPAATDNLAGVETHDAVVRLLLALEPKQRAAVLLTAILDYSTEEAGRMLGLRASSVRSLTTRARARMKQEVVDPHEH